MEIGKIPERTLKSIIFDKLGTDRSEVILGAGLGEDCAALCLAPDEIFVLSTDPITGTTKDMGSLAVTITANDLASSGAKTIGIMLTILLPPKSSEEVLKEIMTHVDSVCKNLDIAVLGGHTEVSSIVTQPLLSVTGIGKVKKENLIKTSDALPGMDLVVTKWVGIEGTSIIAKEKHDELSQVFPLAFIEKSASLDKYISVVDDGLIAAKNGAASMHDVTEGGILGALWEMAEASHCGLTVDLSSIPIMQDTIEICEHYHINPYRLISSGCMLIATANSERLISALETKSIPATVIGQLNNSNDRIIKYDGKTQYLTAPTVDELYKII